MHHTITLSILHSYTINCYEDVALHSFSTEAVPVLELASYLANLLILATSRLAVHFYL